MADADVTAIANDGDSSSAGGIRIPARLRPLYEAIDTPYHAWVAADDDPFGDADAAAAIETLERTVGAFLDGAVETEADEAAVLGVLARRYPRLTHLKSFRAHLETACGRPDWIDTPDPVYWDDCGRPFTVVNGESMWLEDRLQGERPLFDYASFGRRLAARVIDMFFMNVLALTAAVALGLFAGLTGNEAVLGRISGDLSFGGLTAAVTASVLFYVVAEAVHGSTPGKMVLGMTVRSENGMPCSLAQAVKRSLGFCFVDGWFWGIPAAASMRRSPLQQRIGDVWAKTVVVRTHSLPPEQRPLGAVFIGATLAASLCYVPLVGLSWFL